MDAPPQTAKAATRGASHDVMSIALPRVPLLAGEGFSHLTRENFEAEKVLDSNFLPHDALAVTQLAY